MSARPPYVDAAAIVTGWPAYVLARLLPRDRGAERLLRDGLGDRQRDVVLAVVDAIEQASAAWEADATAHVTATDHGRTAADDGSAEPVGPRERPPSAPMTETVSTSRAARALHVSDRRVRQMIDLGELPARREGRQWRVDAAALADLAATRRQEAT